ncbi:MAG: hypothetical protein P1U81_09050 [Verrucomicrobiales bacterium]|jgi:hypothetical protein|nr:hypothetical protein [Verrucomicrobiales bacterium]
MTDSTTAVLSSELEERARQIQGELPSGGLFAEKAWRISPEPFVLTKSEVKQLEKLGPLLHRFQQACDMIYRRSRKGSLPGWISGYLDQGKPGELIELGMAAPLLEKTPGVIRPDLILTDDGFSATELDSVPGGIGLTAWLGQTYAKFAPGSRIIGGADGMIDGFHSLYGDEGADILISEESSDYRPEMEWLSDRLTGDWKVASAESYEAGGRDVYRFFELFDLDNVRGGRSAGEAAAVGELEMTSPFKPWLEEKLWSALFWSRPLRETWRRELRDSNFRVLQQLFPQSWVLDPADVPHHAVIPGLEIQSFHEMKQFSQTERELVIKLSGFNEKAWGSRSVTIGQDVPQDEWAQVIDDSLGAFGETPYVLQRFHAGKLVSHPWLNEATGQLEMMEGRVRLCPYYFVSADSRKVTLGGVLATICPSDKKVLHGMSDAILVPCSVEA